MAVRRAVAVAAFVVALGAAACDVGGEGQPEPSLRWVDCPADIASVVLTELRCGYVTVPEDRSDPDSGTIDVFFLRAQPPGTVEGDPYFSFGYELAQIPSYASIVTPGADEQGNGPELVLMDQRGVGHSRP